MAVPGNLRRSSLAALLAILPVAVGWAQSPAARSSPPRFEVASVKINVSGDSGGSMRTTPGGRFEAISSTMQALIRYAYNVRDFQIEAAPRWFESARYDVVAKAPGKAFTPEFRAMLQRLLAERFALKIEHATKELSVYALSAEKKGARMKENSDGDTTVMSQRGEIIGHRISLAMLANQLSAVLGRPVIDKTGLKARYDVTLRWFPQDQYLPAEGTVPPEAKGPSIFAAVKDQLGLRLEAAKGPVEVLVIGSANKTPLEN